MNFNKEAVRIPHIESPFFQEWLQGQKNVPEKWAKWSQDLFTKGYAVVESAVGLDLIDKAVQSIASLYPDDPGLEPVRYQDLWKQNENMKNISLQKEVMDFLRFAYGRVPIAFQTLNFKYGTQQDMHSDTVHFSCIPRRFMCGLWVAMEDLDANNGPLLYCEGSHKLPEFNYFDLNIPYEKDEYTFYPLYEDFVKQLIKASGFIPKELHIKKGDLMIWSANLLHGGKAILDKKRTRWSQVTHVYFDDCVYFTPMYSEESCGKLYVRNIVDIATGDPVKNKINGKEVELMGDGRERSWVFDEFNPNMYHNLTPENRARFVEAIIKNEKKLPLLLKTLGNRL